MEVQAPPGTTIGYIKQDWHPFLPRFSIQGANKETCLKLEGPCLACNCCGDVNFEVSASLFLIPATVAFLALVLPTTTRGRAFLFFFVVFFYGPYVVTLQLRGKDDNKPIGRISKQWSGLLKEVFTDTDNFGIQFPLDMDVKMKAVLLGACFLIVRLRILPFKARH